jgi:hypothetical protein
MALPSGPVTFDLKQIEQLNKQLSTMRHNVNNNLALLVAAIELLRRKPDLAMKMADSMAVQPDKMNEEIQRFSAHFEKAFGISRENPFPLVPEEEQLLKPEDHSSHQEQKGAGETPETQALA